MAKKKVLLAIAFVAIAMASGGIVSVYAMNQGSAEAKDTSQAASVETVQSENIETVQTENAKLVETEIQGEVQAEKMTFSCGIDGCTQTEVHQHGLCGIDGCTQIGEHSHGGNSGGHHHAGHH